MLCCCRWRFYFLLAELFLFVRSFFSSCFFCLAHSYRMFDVVVLSFTSCMLLHLCIVWKKVSVSHPYSLVALYNRVVWLFLTLLLLLLRSHIHLFIHWIFIVIFCDTVAITLSLPVNILTFFSIYRFRFTHNHTNTHIPCISIILAANGIPLLLTDSITIR